MWIGLWITILLFAANIAAFSQEIDVEKVARPEREELARCLSDSLSFVEKHQLSDSLRPVLEMVCAQEIERVISAAKIQIKDDVLRDSAAGMFAYGMVWKAFEIYKSKPVAKCPEGSCKLDEYRACVMNQMPSSIRKKLRPIEFENFAQQQCELKESDVRSVLTNDLDKVLRRHLAGHLTHEIHDLINNITAGTRHGIVVLYGEDLRKIQPSRKSCKPEMCGASPCISLVEKPSEYECVISQ